MHPNTPRPPKERFTKGARVRFVDVVPDVADEQWVGATGTIDVINWSDNDSPKSQFIHVKVDKEVSGVSSQWKTYGVWTTLQSLERLYE